MDLDSVCDELYGLPLDEFTTTRADRERQAKSAGEADLAAQIHRLAKPNLVAWLANQLAREDAEQIRTLLDLGVGLREATAAASGQALRELSRQQRQLVEALVHQTRRLAKAAGRTVAQETARDLQDTLRAALADPDAADALAAGRLTKAMHSSGFGILGIGDEPQAGSPTKPTPPEPSSPEPSSPAPRRVALQREHPESLLEQARSTADAAIRARTETRDQLASADRSLASAASGVQRAREELAEALQAQSRAEKARITAQAAHDRANRHTLKAEQGLTRATERLEQLAP